MWFLPTRNRPQACRELLAAMQSTEIPKVTVMIDGPPYEIDWPAHWRIHQSEEHLEMQRALNLLYKLYPNEPWYGLITDHSRPVTKNWSTLIEKEVEPFSVILVNDTKNRLHPDSGLRRITSASAYGGELVRTLGWVWLNTVVHMYGDDAWERIGHVLGIKYLPDVIVKDLLVREGEIQRDGNHDRLYRGRAYIAGDRFSYGKWLKDFPRLIEKLKALKKALKK